MNEFEPSKEDSKLRPLEIFNAAKTSHKIILVLSIVIHLSFLFGLKDGFWRRLFSDTQRVWIGTDTFSIYEAGYRVRQGLNIYVREDGEPTKSPYSSGYRYLPFSAFLLGIPLSLLPPIEAYKIWVGIIELLVVVNIILTFRWTRGRKLLLAAMWLAFAPFYVEICMGQFSFLMSSLIFWTYLTMDKKKDIPLGFFWIWSVLLKSFTIFLLFIWIKMRKWQLLFWCILIILLTSVPYYLLFPKGWDYFRLVNLEITIGLGGPTYKGAHSLQALLSFIAFLLLPKNVLFHYLGREITFQNVFPLFITTGIFALIVYLTFLRKTDSEILFTLWITFFFVCFRDVWENQYLMIIPLFVILAGKERLPLGYIIPAFILIALPSAFGLFQKPEHFADIYETQWTLPMRGIYHLQRPLGVVILLIGQVREAFLSSSLRSGSE